MASCTNLSIREVLASVLPHVFGSSAGQQLDEPLPCPHLSALRQEFRLLGTAAPVLVSSAVLGPELTWLFALAFWISPFVRDDVRVWLATSDVLLSAGCVLAARIISVSVHDFRWWLPLVALAASGIAVGFWVPEEPLWGSSFLHPESSLRVIGVATAEAFAVAAAQPIAKAALPHIVAGFAMERSVRAAIPALPLVMFVLEGFVEPHAKWLSGYDFFVRVVGVLGTCLFLGRLVDFALSGAAALLQGVLYVLTGPGAVCRAVSRSAVRLSLEGPSGSEVLIIRLPVALLFCTTLLAGMACTVRFGYLSAEALSYYHARGLEFKSIIEDVGIRLASTSLLAEFQLHKLWEGFNQTLRV